MITGASILLVCGLLFALSSPCVAQFAINGLALPALEVDFLRAFGKPDSINFRFNEYEGQVEQHSYHGSEFDAYESIDNPDSGKRCVMIGEVRLDESPTWQVAILGKTYTHLTTYASAVKMVGRRAIIRRKSVISFNPDEGSFCILSFRKSKLYSVQVGDSG